MSEQAFERLPPVYMSREVVDALPEYSMSLPTGRTPGKRWKRDAGDGRWALGEYGVPDPSGGTIPIHWRRIVVLKPVRPANE